MKTYRDYLKEHEICIFHGVIRHPIFGICAHVTEPDHDSHISDHLFRISDQGLTARSKSFSVYIPEGSRFIYTQVPNGCGSTMLGIKIV